MPSKSQIEIEVKFFIEEPKVIRQQIIELGATLIQQKCFELNLRYEDSQNSLGRNHRLLRLRKSHKTTLTYKQRRIDMENQFKVHHEMEVEIDNFDMMMAILTALGYRQAQVYEKWRETYRLDDTIFCLDTMPYGEFLEIEGKKTEILKSTAQLGLDWRSRILLNYLELFDKIKKQLHLTFNDLTFDNFKPIDIALKPIILSYTVG